LIERLKVSERFIQEGFPTSKVLHIAGVSRSTYYWWKEHQYDDPVENKRGGRPVPGITLTIDGRELSDEAVKDLLRAAIEGYESVYGYKKSTYHLRREYGLIINKKKVYRLCKQMGVLQAQRKKKQKHPRRLSRNRVIDGINQLWEIDIKYGYIVGEKRFFFVAVILDICDRMVIDYHIGYSCTGSEAARALEGALELRSEELNGALPDIRTDNGPQFLSKAFEEFCYVKGLVHECIPVRTPNKNAHIEAFHSILEEECLSRYEFGSFSEAYVTVVDWIDHYNHRRLHGSLQYRTPAEYHEACLSKTVSPAPIKL
jgi:putative transposase